MPQDFSFQSLRGYSFKGLDLTGADFSHSDIRGTDCRRKSYGRIPWHLWDFFDRYPQAEVALQRFSD